MHTYYGFQYDSALFSDSEAVIACDRLPATLLSDFGLDAGGARKRGTGGGALGANVGDAGSVFAGWPAPLNVRVSSRRIRAPCDESLHFENASTPVCRVRSRPSATDATVDRSSASSVGMLPHLLTTPYQETECVPKKTTILVGALLSCLGASACERTTSSILAPSSTSSSVDPSAPLDSANAQLLAKGLAMALTAPDLRRQLLEDMRDSPFEYHALHFATYLLGQRGNALSRATANALMIPGAQLATMVSMANAGKGFELVMPRYGDRRKWLGDTPLQVFATTRSVTEVMKFPWQASGYDSLGAIVKLDLQGVTSAPYLAIRPVTQDFGANPEVSRVLAPKKKGKTIGEPDETHGATQSGASRTMIIGCDTCSDGGGGPGELGYLVLPSGQTYEDCNTYQYGNQITESCRKELAQAFRPRLIFNSDEPCPLREPSWTVRWTGVGGDEIAIFYALSYYNDCGFRSSGAFGHNGDSEFLIVRVHPQATARNHWYLSNVTLSAHYGAYTDNTWTGDPPAVEFRQGEYLTRPLVYISWGKHGNYRDVGSCGRGAGYLDDCGMNTGPTDVEVGGINIGDMGTRAYPTPTYVGAVQSRFGRTGQEAFWYPAGFNGWANDYSSSATPYSFLLSDFGY